jgi:hypothetical protein
MARVPNPKYRQPMPDRAVIVGRGASARANVEGPGAKVAEATMSGTGHESLRWRCVSLRKEQR